VLLQVHSLNPSFPLQPYLPLSLIIPYLLDPSLFFCPYWPQSEEVLLPHSLLFVLHLNDTPDWGLRGAVFLAIQVPILLFEPSPCSTLFRIYEDHTCLPIYDITHSSYTLCP